VLHLKALRKGLEIRENLKFIPSLKMGGLVMEGALQDDQLELFAPLLPPSKPLLGDRGTINGIVYVLRSGSRLRELPRNLSTPLTCHLRYEIFVLVAMHSTISP
jgi:hypothetical protein